MKYKTILKYTAMFSAAVFLFSCAKKSEDEREKSGQRQVLSGEAEVLEPEATPFAVYYDIKLSDDTVTIYEVTEEGENEVRSVKIDEEYYPLEDIQALRKGIIAYTKEGAYEILENFAN